MPYFAQKNFCTGCSACTSVCPVQCIEMKEDEYGFHFPVILDASKCISCEECKEVCPAMNDCEITNNMSLAFAAYSKDSILRMDSSSGGIFSELATEVLKREGAVFGAAYSDKFEIQHICVTTCNELRKLRGAKYAESQLRDTFSAVKKKLQEGKYVLFSGTPCQVAGLRCFLKQEYDHLFCVDFICHGVPSPMVWRKYVEYRVKVDADGQLPVEVNLREKASGWSKYQYSNYFKYPDGTIYREVSTSSVYMKLFTEDYISRESCENCKFKGYSRCSDITLGDFWGIWDIAPELDDNKGMSAIIIHSEKGNKLWHQIEERIFFTDVLLDQISRQNSSLLNSSPSNKERKAVLEKIRKDGFDSLPLKKKSDVRWKRIPRRLLQAVKRR